jgi:hypothetical protein
MTDTFRAFTSSRAHVVTKEADFGLEQWTMTPIEPNALDDRV